jgi:tetratricopeptide (TPR) repeat protein
MRFNESDEVTFLDGAVVTAFSEAESLIKASDLPAAKLLLEVATRDLKITPFVTTGLPDADIELRKLRFQQFTVLALASGKTGRILERHDDVAAIASYMQAISLWSSAWKELDCITTEWEIQRSEIVDDGYDRDFSWYYAQQIAESHARMQQWQDVISAVGLSAKLSGEMDYQLHDLLSEAYDGLGDYRKFMDSCEAVREHWCNVNDSDRELFQICYMASSSEGYKMYDDALRAYDLFFDYYWRYEYAAGRIEFNKGCLHVLKKDIGAAYVAFHSARRFFLANSVSPDDLVRCDQAIALLQKAIETGVEDLPEVSDFSIGEICSFYLPWLK